MNHPLAFDFVVDKSTNTISIKREFNAEAALVWDAFTQPEILDQWGAPAPWVARTKYMKFEEGGHRLYAMVSPEGKEHWSIQQYTSITPITHFTMLTNFADEEGNINTAFKSSVNNLHFSEENGTTTVSITIQYSAPEVLQMMIEGGFREGFGMTMDNLERLLAILPGKQLS